jgi:hypothetical protein
MRFLLTITRSYLIARSGIFIYIGEVAKNALIITFTLKLASVCFFKRSAKRKIQATNTRRGIAETLIYISNTSNFR